MRYDPKLWANLKGEYETGTISISKLYTKYTANGPCPSIQAIKQHAAKYKWKRGKKLPKIQAKIEQTIEDMLAKAGVPKKKALEVLAKGITEPTMLKFEGKGDQMICTPMPDYATIHRYLQEYFKLTGMYPAQHIDHTTKGKAIQSNTLIANLVSLPLDDLNNIIAKKLARFGSGIDPNNITDADIEPVGEVEAVGSNQ